MKQIIFRVDDRLIHGQVIEGWIKNFHIFKVVIANDALSANPVQQTIYQSVVPPKTEVSFYSIEELKQNWDEISAVDGYLLVIFADINDLYACKELISGDVYINIGCVASRGHCITVSDTVFLEPDEMKKLNELATEWQIHIKKLPWEKDAGFCARQGD